MPANYCPHCGENVQLLSEAEPAAAAAPAPAPAEIIRREVTTKEKDRIWGSLPLPYRLVPIGVMGEDGAENVLVCEDDDKRLWALSNGEAKLLNMVTPPPMPAPPVPAPLAANPPTVPLHNCYRLEPPGAREDRGRDRYGSAR